MSVSFGKYHTQVLSAFFFPLSVLCVIFASAGVDTNVISA